MLYKDSFKNKIKWNTMQCTIISMNIHKRPLKTRTSYIRTRALTDSNVGRTSGDPPSLLSSRRRPNAGPIHKVQGPVSTSEKTSFRKISWSLEAARFVFEIVRSLWNLTGTSAALLPICLSNFKAIRQFKVPISWLRDFTRSYEKTSYPILRRGPGD